MSLPPVPTTAGLATFGTISSALDPLLSVLRLPADDEGGVEPPP